MSMSLSMPELSMKNREPASPPNDCQTVFAYCPGLSKCFRPASTQWGWSIDLDQVDLGSGDSLTCQVHTEAGDCGLGENVGSFTISRDSVEWIFNPGFGAVELELYSGQCEANDSGKHLQSGVCNAESISMYAGSPQTYSLVADGFDPALPDFTLDATDNVDFRRGVWESQDYLVFPISSRYISAHATVCPCSSSEVSGCEENTIEESPSNEDSPSNENGPIRTNNDGTDVPESDSVLLHTIGDSNDSSSRGEIPAVSTTDISPKAETVDNGGDSSPQRGYRPPPTVIFAATVAIISLVAIGGVFVYYTSSGPSTPSESSSLSSFSL